MFKNVKNLAWNEDNIQGGNLTMGNCKIKLPSAPKHRGEASCATIANPLDINTNICVKIYKLFYFTGMQMFSSSGNGEVVCIVKN